MANFEALTFFFGPVLSIVCGCLCCVDVVPRSVLPSTFSTSSSSYPCEDVACSSSAFAVASFIAYATTTAFATFFYSAAFCSLPALPFS